MYRLLIIYLLLLTIKCSNNIVDGTSDETSTGQAYATISGDLVTIDGEPAPGASASLFRITGYKAGADTTSVAATLSDTNGRYTFSDVSRGKYRLRFILARQSDTLFGVRESIEVDSARLEYLGTDTLAPAGAVRGTLRRDGYDVGNTFCFVPGRSHVAISDHDGTFLLGNLEPGTYAVRFVHQFFEEKVVNSIRVQSGDTTDLGIIKLNLGTNQFERNIGGSLLTGSDSIGRIQTVISGDGIPTETPRVFPLTWFPKAGKYSGFVFVPYKGNHWTAAVEVYNNDGNLIGYTELSFDRTTGDIPVHPFYANNACPRVIAGPNDTVSIGDTVFLYATAVDSFGGFVEKWQWEIEDSLTLSVSNGEAWFVAPSGITSSETEYTCIASAFDNDGNHARDTTTIQVVRDPPVIHSHFTSSFAKEDTVRVNVATSDKFGSVREIRWKIGSTGDFVSVPVRDTLVNYRYEYHGHIDILRPTAVGSSRRCIVEVTDDDGVQAFDTLLVKPDRFLFWEEVLVASELQSEIVRFAVFQERIWTLGWDVWRSDDGTVWERVGPCDRRVNLKGVFFVLRDSLYHISRPKTSEGAAVVLRTGDGQAWTEVSALPVDTFGTGLKHPVVQGDRVLVYDFRERRVFESSAPCTSWTNRELTIPDSSLFWVEYAGVFGDRTIAFSRDGRRYDSFGGYTWNKSGCGIPFIDDRGLPVIEANDSRIIVFHEQISVSHTPCAWVSMNYDPPFAKQYGLWDSAVSYKGSILFFSYATKSVWMTE